jgi:hypothetical protein
MDENERLANHLSSEFHRLSILYSRGNISAEEFLKFIRQVLKDENFGI